MLPIEQILELARISRTHYGEHYYVQKKIGTERAIEIFKKYLRGEITRIVATKELGNGLSIFRAWIGKYQTLILGGLAFINKR